jgi:DNA (cytosine-5)-methyltransferase 1
MELTHASFFSGVGGLDLGLERAGWRTVSFSEIDTYASAVLAERWPGVPNLGDITDLLQLQGPVLRRDVERGRSDISFHTATLWTGGFPCQDLSVAGKRRGMGTEDERTRSGLAYAFLDLVERHRPPAILLENVPGLLSSNGGKDFGALLGRLGELGYWWAYRILDAQFFGVPQRRRRVFICAFHAESGLGADSAGEVLSVGTRCEGHSQAGDEARTAASDGLAAGISRALSTSQERLDADTESFIVRPSPDTDRVREADGLAGRLDDRLPLGLDSHRYRCCGNGVVSNVSEWIGARLAGVLE